jgi:ribosome-binding protein aMBF1 (putative translation factor)
MIKDKYEQMLNNFELYYPEHYKKAVDWWASGRMSITVKLEDGDMYEYDRVDNSLRRLRTKDIEEDETLLSKELGANLRKTVPLTGMTQKELADKLGITTAMLSRYIHGVSTPSATKLHRIAKIVGCTMDELFDDTYIE